MSRRPSSTTRLDTLVPYPTLFRSVRGARGCGSFLPAAPAPRLPALDRRDSPPVRTRLSAPRARCCVASNDSSGIAPPAHQPCFPLVLVESAHVFIAAVSTLAQPEDSGARRHWPRRSPPFREDWIGKPSADAAAQIGRAHV